jgi:hypothetical protein
MTEKNEIVKKEEVMDLASYSIDSSLKDQMKADSADYDDGMSADHLEIPRLKIAQALTAETIKSNAKYIEGLEAGDVINTLTKQITKGGDPVYFVPAIRKISYIEFKDKKLVKHYGDDSSVYHSLVPDEKQRRKTPSGGEIHETQESYIFVLDLKNKTYTPVLFPQKSYKMKAFNMMIRMTGVVEYGSIFKLITKPESKDGNDWFGFEITRVNDTLAIPELGQAVYNEAKQFNQSFSEKKISVDYDDEEVPSSTNDDRI